MLDIMVSTYASNSSGIAQLFKEISCCAASLLLHRFSSQQLTLLFFIRSPLERIVVVECIFTRLLQNLIIITYITHQYII